MREETERELDVKAKSLLTTFGFTYKATKITGDAESPLSTTFEVAIYRNSEEVAILQTSPGDEKIDWLDVLELVEKYIVLPAYKIGKIIDDETKLKEYCEQSYQKEKSTILDTEVYRIKKATFTYDLAVSFFKELRKIYGNKFVDFIMAHDEY